MSMKNMGFCLRAFMAARTSSTSTTKWGAPVEEITMSTSGRWSRNSSKGTARPWNFAARASARARVRFVTCTPETPFSIRCVAASSHISPAPITRTFFPSRVPKILRASSTAANEMETAAWAMRVSVRTRFATLNALCMKRLSTRPVAEPSAAFS